MQENCVQTVRRRTKYEFLPKYMKKILTYPAKTMLWGAILSIEQPFIHCCGYDESDILYRGSK